MLYERESLQSYLYMLALFGAMDVFACLWSGGARMESGRFLTIKADAENHGFGLDSIRRTVESYRGEMACRMEEGEFSLSMIFPRGDESEGDTGVRE